MEAALDTAALWFARACGVYVGGFLILASFFCVHVLVLFATLWTVARRRPVPGSIRLAVELVYGLLNPALYLAIISGAMPALRPSWAAPLPAVAWCILAAFWSARLFGARTLLRPLIILASAVLAAYILKDAGTLAALANGKPSWTPFLFPIFMLGPLYLIPAVLLFDFRRAAPESLLLLSRRTAGASAAAFAAAAAVLVTSSTLGRSESSVRQLVLNNRTQMAAAAARHDIDPRLLAAIVYVTHRDQLTPFRDSAERFAAQAWAWNLRRDFRQAPPDNTGPGADANSLFNLPFDLSIGLAQIKPRTAQTAAVLATGVRPEALPTPIYFRYRDAEPTSPAWDLTLPTRPAPLRASADRDAVVAVLLDPASNLDTAALILSLYQHQWESTNPAFTLRQRPDILATLYSLGFSRSRPHAAPRPNSFGLRVARVMAEPWLATL
jgi:hypothetical protein